MDELFIFVAPHLACFGVLAGLWSAVGIGAFEYLLSLLCFIWSSQPTGHDVAKYTIQGTGPTVSLLPLLLLTPQVGEVLLFCLPIPAYILFLFGASSSSTVKNKGKERRSKRQMKYLPSSPHTSASRACSASSLKLPHPYSAFPSLSLLPCSIRCFVATFVAYMKPRSIDAPFWVNSE